MYHIYDLLLQDNATPEASLCGDFLQWQGRPWQLHPHTVDTFKDAQGTSRPVIYQNGTLIAVGFMALALHFHQQGIINAA